MAEAVFDKILMYTEEESKQKAVERSKNYILGNWSGIMLSMESNSDLLIPTMNLRYHTEKHSCLKRLWMLLLATERETAYEKDCFDHRNNTDPIYFRLTAILIIPGIIMLIVWFKIRTRNQINRYGVELEQYICTLAYTAELEDELNWTLERLIDYFPLAYDTIKEGKERLRWK